MNESQLENENCFQGYVDQSVTFSSWRKVEYKVSQILKQNIEKKLMNPVNKQIIFQLLGSDFVNKYFSNYTNSPAVLDNINSDERRKKESEMKTYMSSVINEALQKSGPKSDTKLQSDVQNFSHELQNVVEINYNDHYSQIKSKKRPKTDLHEKLISTLLTENSNGAEQLIPALRKNLVVLTDNLRMTFWPACISSKEKSKNIKNSEKIKEKFTQLYTRERKNGDLDKNIESAVYKVYKETECLKTINSEDNRKSSVTILSICNAYGRKFQPHFVFPASVVQQVYLKEKLKASEDNYGEASFLLEKILRLGILTNDKADKIASSTYQTLVDLDKPLEKHIKLMLTSKQKHDEVTSSETVSEAIRNTSADSSDITFYLKQWIFCMFASVLKPYALLFIWDQLFYNRFENKIFQDITLALLGLLKPWFFLAKNKENVTKVFLEEPSMLYLLDIRKALSHIQKRGNFHDIPVMNRNISINASEPTPMPPTPPPPVPKPVVLPPKPPLIKPIPTFTPWVPFNKEKKKELNLVQGKVNIPFDFYVDSVRFIPDSATIIKVTGKVLNLYLNQKNKSLKFQSYPELNSYWRYPNFKFKQVVNKEGLPMNPDVVIMLRVYAVEQHSKNTYVLGSCLFGPFSNKHGKDVKLRIGGHQVRVRHGIPDPDFNMEHMLASHMDNNPVIPGVTILLRVLNQDKEYINAPGYETNYYRSEIAKPNESENRLYNHYKKSETLSMSVKDSALLTSGQTLNSDAAIKQLIQQQLHKEGSDVEDFPYQRFIHYCKNQGMMVLVDKAAGLPLFLEGRYLQCLVQIFPGEDTKIGHGTSQAISFITNELELTSFQRAPDWSDHPKKVHPEYDSKAFILVCLYGLRPKFDANTGKLMDKDGREPKFNLQQAIAWTAAPCFDKDAVFAGVHHVPLLKGRPPDDIIEKLSYLPLDFICKKFKTQVKVFVHSDFLNISKNPVKYTQAFNIQSGATVVDLLKSGLSDPSEFNKHKLKMIELLNKAFKNNLDNSLSKSGYKPTV
ncbi:uncharacterized protein [Parasteatoda tepidariorum]|uniref:uncharacterized protein isoform X2 n=1 Tax=Parasteatoda tepidariorum TaxID=114398 RepID=UPI0039BC2F5F